MRNTSTDTASNRASGRAALAALLAVQIVLGYEWLASGLTKLVHGDFPGGLHDDLVERSAASPGWFRDFLEAAVIPHATSFGYLIEIGEVAIGVVLIATASAGLLAWERLPRLVRLAALVATVASALAALVLNVSFHLAAGGSLPRPVAADSFEEAIDLDSLMAGLELLIVAVSIGAFVSLVRGGGTPPISNTGTPPTNNTGRVATLPAGREMIVMQNHIHGGLRRRGRLALRLLAPLVAGLALGAAFLGTQGGTASTTTATGEVTALRAALAGTQQDATFWRQLTALFKPAPANLRSMQDHRLVMLPGGIALGLHFDNMNLAKAKNLNWAVLGVPGTFTKADQQRVTKQFGPGYVHFHDFAHDTHGGQPGAKGFWFVHVGARDFTSMFGAHVKTGVIDLKMMPTPPRS